MKRFLSHLPHYINLVGVLIFALIAFHFFSYDKRFQVGVAIALSASYFSWGVVHHFLHKNCCFSVLIEYLAVSILGLVMILSLIFRS